MATTATVTGETPGQGSLCASRSDAALPSPANSRNPLSTTATEYSGWLRNRMNFWMKAISTNRNASPSSRK